MTDVDLAQLRYTLENPRALDWCAPPLVPADWHDVSAARAVEIVRSIAAFFDDMGDETRRIATDFRIDRLRTGHIACYPEAMLVEMQGHGRFGRPGRINVLVDAASITMMTGGSEPVHELNGRLPPDLSTEDGRVAYLHFFMNWVHGAEGRFQPVATVDALRARLVSGAVVDPAWPLFAPRAVEGGDANPEDGYIRELSLIYADSLFHAIMKIKPGGGVEMLQDTPVAEGLPVVREIMEGSLLVAVSQTGH